MDAQIYQIIEKTHINTILQSFHICSELSIQLLDDLGNIIFSVGEQMNFCKKIESYLLGIHNCNEFHILASKRAISIGESYIFPCNASLNHITYPILYKGTYMGSVLVGPFLLDKADSTLITELSKKNQLPTSALLDLYDELNAVPVITPVKATHMSKLLSQLMLGVFAGQTSNTTQNQGKLLQQSKINESIQQYKNGGDQIVYQYPYDKEKALIGKVKNGDMDSAKKLLNDLLGYVFFSEGNEIGAIKVRSLELCSLLSRAAIEGGAATQDIFFLNNNFYKNLNLINSIDELCFVLQDTVIAFVENSFTQKHSPNSVIIKKAIHYIGEHFHENITLSEIADEVHLNPSYLSSVFKSTTGASFKDYLNTVRIEECKRLLLHTDYSLVDIAIACGYEDQSYFSKVFKKYTGISPKQYRS